MRISPLEYVKMQVEIANGLISSGSSLPSKYLENLTDYSKKFTDKILLNSGVTVSDEPEVKPMTCENEWRNLLTNTLIPSYSDEANSLIIELRKRGVIV